MKKSKVSGKIIVDKKRSEAEAKKIHTPINKAATVASIRIALRAYIQDGLLYELAVGIHA